MVKCPACGTEVGDRVGECPRCKLPETLFDAVRDAAGGAASAPDAAYLRTIGELLSTVERGAPAATPSPPPRALIGRAGRFPSLPAAAPPPVEERRTPTPLPSLKDLPRLPGGAPFAETRKRLDEYFLLGRRLGLDFTDFEARFGAANLSDDLPSLDTLVREMFVHLASVLAEEYESALARRNELAQLMPTRSADVEFEAIRRAISIGDLAGAQRRLVHVRDELQHAEEEWEVGRILVTECDLLVETCRTLGGDPRPVLGLLDEGRKKFREGKRPEAERLLARAALALWTVLEPRFTEDLRRMRDRMVEARQSGADVTPALQALRNVAAELRTRNFGGTVLAYRQLKATLERLQPPEGSGPLSPLTVGPPTPSA
jgi:hypothetical protein